MEHINKILNRRSQRNYLNKEIEQEKIDAIFDVINSSPTCTNSHDYSAIVITDKEVREKISLNLPTQKHIIDAPLFILFCADTNRIDLVAQSKQQEVCTDSFNSFLTASGDCFISATFAHNAALSLGLGACFIGISRVSASYLKEKLNLENRMLPIIGLTIGYIEKENEIKPKINHVYFDKYDSSKVKQEIEEYDSRMLSYYDERNANNKNAKWSDVCLKPYSIDTKELDDYYKKVWGLK